ncbi:Rha family transcriptional regulator [Variovorax ureilyticus]|uniref:Rha family transcriptional regulator n=1 Tax=Variovorax ureilyticus TaxID=1836198 RepID=A0ABU8VF64_9BURK
MTNKITLVGSLGGKSEEQSKLTTLLYGNRTVRAVCIDGALWLSAADVAHVLGFSGGSPVVDSTCGSDARYFPNHNASNRFRIIDGADLAQMIGKAPCGAFLARQFASWMFREAQPAVLGMFTRKDTLAANDEAPPRARANSQPKPIAGGDLMPMPAVSEPLTMSSREIAELTGKEHKNVLADIRKMLSELGKTSADFSANLPDAYGRPQAAYLLPKRETLILMSGYSIELRARIIDRWQELETAHGGQPARMLTEAERLMLQAQVMLKLERENVELRNAQERLRAVTARQAEKLECIADDVKLIADSKVHDAPPAGTETISSIRRRARVQHGLGADLVGWLIREAEDFRLPVVGQVRNPSENENAPPTCHLYQTRSATLAMERFMRDAKPVPGTQRDYTHPAYRSRFRLHKGGHLHVVK